MLTLSLHISSLVPLLKSLIPHGCRANKHGLRGIPLHLPPTTPSYGKFYFRFHSFFGLDALDIYNSALSLFLEDKPLKLSEQILNTLLREWKSLSFDLYFRELGGLSSPWLCWTQYIFRDTRLAWRPAHCTLLLLICSQLRSRCSPQS